jgi:hypothetical protein
VNKVTWYGLYTDLHGTSYGGTSSRFSIRFFADDGTGLAPVNAPPFFAELVTVDAVPTGIITTGDGHEVFSYSATLSSEVSLPSGTFWLSIVEADAGTDDTWEWADNSLGVGTAINVRKIPGALDDWTLIPIIPDTQRSQRPFVLAYDPQPSVTVPIDIKPGSPLNSINPRSKAIIPVAILTTDTFDATTVDPLSVQFGPSGATEANGDGLIKDVNSDRRPDLVFHFNTQSTGITCGDTSASLTGETFDGQQIEGTDSITTVGCKK